MKLILQSALQVLSALGAIGMIVADQPHLATLDRERPPRRPPRRHQAARDSRMQPKKATHVVTSAATVDVADLKIVRGIADERDSVVRQ